MPPWASRASRRIDRQTGPTGADNTVLILFHESRFRDKPQSETFTSATLREADCSAVMIECTFSSAMPETIQLFRILLAAPADTMEEQIIVPAVIAEWNVQHGDGMGVRVELLNWRTHAHPAAGGRPQALINRQFADRADIVLAIFWRRLGSPTGQAASGTVEEIERARRPGKKVMVYFSQRLGPDGERLDSREQAKMEQFRKQLGKNALYWTYPDLKEFETTVRKHLALVMR